MKRIISLLLVVCIALPFAGCSAVLERLSTVMPMETEPTEKTFTVNNYPLQIVADTSFYDKTGGSFDLQITNDSCYLSVMPYLYSELPEGIAAQDVYDIQNEEIFSKREAVTPVAEAKTQSLPQGEMIYGVYSAEKDGVENYYATYLIDFPGQEICAWVLVTAVPSYYQSNTDYLHNIVCSLSAVE